VADALSRKYENCPATADLSISLISFPTQNWVADLKASYGRDLETQSILLNLQQNLANFKNFSLQQGLLLKNGRLWVVRHSPFQLQLLEFLHSNPTAGHSGYHKIVHRAKTDFYCRGMQKDIRQFVQECVVCQVSKPELIHPPSLLQPFPIPSRVWSDISMDLFN
jgi:hypothetical protein